MEQAFEPLAPDRRRPGSTPWHFWLVAILALLWNMVGAFDYSATLLEVKWYIAQMPPERLAAMDEFPAWEFAAWALGVWGSVAGSLLLLLRCRWALAAFVASIAGMAVNTVFLVFSGWPVLEPITIAIWLILVALTLYSRAMIDANVLR